MTDIAGSREDEFEVSCGLDACIHPVVVGLFEAGGVLPDGAGGEAGLILGKMHFHLPAGAGEQVEHPDIAADASVRVIPNLIIHGGCAVGGVSDDAVIGLNTTAGPGTAHGNVPEFHHAVGIDVGFSGGLIDGRPDLTSHFRQDDDADIVILQLHHIPFLVDRLLGKTIKPVIGINRRLRRDGIGV